MPVCFELNNWNLGDWEQEINKKTLQKNNINFLMLANITVSFIHLII
jgi:hypothetical protein